MTIPARWLSLLFITFAFSAHAQEQAAAPAAPTADDLGWPREMTSGTSKLTIYQPQVESWSDNQLKQRAAVSVSNGSSPEPIFGVIWMEARTEVNKATHVVTLEDLKITRASFPSDPKQKDDFEKIIQKNAPVLLKPVALERLQASLEITKAESSNKAPDLKNAPPRIIYSSTPALLLLIDGKPELRQTGVENLLRVINTRALVLFNQTEGKYYFYMGDRWMVSSSLDESAKPSSWSAPDQSPGHWTSDFVNGLNQAKASAVADKQVDLLDQQASLIDELKKGMVPKIYVSSSPAELIQTQGNPQFEPVSNTKLLYVKNSENNIFLDTESQNYYITLAGRWYHSDSLEGSWSYEASSKLPPDFKKIPENHPKGTVLASVAGTPEAKEAAISNDIPQTAEIDRSTAGPNIQYDHGAEFHPIENTPLQYAVNSATPVIQVNDHSYYSVQNGVWFVSNTPDGPWIVATSVPASIYTIPPSSPLYYVTYVHVYGYTPHEVYVGYMPGYLGSYVDSDGVVVFGTGYSYQPWIGSVWYGPPVTFGFGVSWGIGFGWVFPTGYFGGYYGAPCFHPWWGPWGWGWSHGVHYTGVAFNPGFRGNIHINTTNVYRSWSPGVVRSTWARGAATPFRAGTRSAVVRGQNNIYADRSGQVFRHNGQNWEQYRGSAGTRAGWNRVTPTAEAPRSNFQARPAMRQAPQQQFHELDQERAARQMGNQRTQMFSHSGGFAPSHSTSTRRAFTGGGGGGESHGGGRR